MSMKKRGNCIFPNLKAQVSIFMLIGIIILMIALLYFFYQREAVEEVEFVQPELVPVNSYVENCLKRIAEDDLTTIGLSGGYITVPERINKDPRTYLTSFPAAGFKMPLWWYDGIEAVPPESFIKQQLKDHIETELKSCINNFEPFAEKFEINALKEPVVEVKFNDNDVSINLKYLLEVIAKDGSFKALAEDFAYAAPIRFKKVYELAKLMMERENKDYFLERRTIDLYSIDTEIPTTDIEATCKTKVWQLSDIKNRLQTLLRVNLPYIKIKGTDYNPRLYVPNPSGKDIYADSYYQQHYVWEIDKEPSKYRSMKVAFTYDNWPMQIYARPSQNGILKSNAQKGAEMLKFFCLHIWHFTYDISYPVLVSIFDKETEKNKAYQFNFAFKVSVDHNQPNRINKGATLFEAIPDLSSEEYCNDVQNEITVFTIDNATGEDVKDVNLTFVCGRYYCDIGKSDWLSLGAAAGITKRLPYCVLGIVKGAKQGYADAQSFMQTDVDGRSYILLLNPIKEFQNYKIVKHKFSDSQIPPNPLLGSETPQELGQNEKASILIKGKDISYESFAVYPKETDFPLALPSKDATYEVTIYLIDEEDIIGGYTGDWKVGKDDLKDANEIIFHVIAQGAASEDERALFISGLSSYSKQVPSPEIK